MQDATAALAPPATELDGAPALGSLDRAGCEEILVRNKVGRLAFALHDRVNVIPVNFIYADGWIYGRTQPGGKLFQILRNRRVAFEVDEQDGIFSWRSVIVHGPLYAIDPESNANQRVIYESALKLIRSSFPTALTESDPVPFRTELFRIEATEMSGRSSSGGGVRIMPTQPNTPDKGTNAEADASLSAAARAAIAKVYASPQDVNVDAFDNVVVLSGTMDTAAERTETERQLLAMPTVKAIVQQIETAYPAQLQPSPSELARSALRELNNGPPLAGSDIKIIVEHDWLRAEGTAKSQDAKEEALRRLRSVTGVRGVLDSIRI
jgi:nitroimidazol reductase NimA-like FMN-containing flavoprotein (pyridoxamine 5'-phosphate oxidase superfamily)